MIDSKELLFTVDENNEPIKPIPRDKAHSKGIWHRSTGVWVVDDGKVLCQKRSLKKDTHRGMWQADFGGHVLSKETYLDNARNELAEETGLRLPKSKFRHMMTFKYSGIDETTGIDDREFLGIFVVDWQGNTSELKLEEDEVQTVRWYTLNELSKLIGRSDDWVVQGYEQELISKLKSQSRGEL